MSLPYRTIKAIDLYDFNKLVRETYGRPYNFQQQDDCKSRGFVSISVPEDPYDYTNDTIPEIVNHNDMGVSFKAWLERDPAQLLSSSSSPSSLNLWWDRNFYPHVSRIINDLHSKGLIEAGDYSIDIDW